MVSLAAPAKGSRVLEPSAGTGSLLRALERWTPLADYEGVTAIEINPSLVAGINKHFPPVATTCGDFLRFDPRDLGSFDVIVMNPPFANAQDIAHIQHARKFLAPYGRLVAICAGGPRQREALGPIAVASGGMYEPLPAGTFATSGTTVSTALVVIYA
jgi:16S rRNA G1207 methylase RsmC